MEKFKKCRWSHQQQHDEYFCQNPAAPSLCECVSEDDSCDKCDYYYVDELDCADNKEEGEGLL